jgi:SAM-dependent methyltransferase
MSESVWGADSDLWQVIPEPFKPSTDDIALYRRAIPPELLAEDAKPRILLLGVTPPLADLPWPAGSELHAVDYDDVMIATLWKPRPGAQCHLARWQDMPLPDDHFDLVIGDGSFSALASGDDYDGVLREIARVSRPSAPLIARFFIRPEPRMSLTQVAEAAPTALAHYRAASKRLLVLLAAANPDGTAYTPDVPGRIAAEWGDLDEYLLALNDPLDERELSKVVFGFEQRLNYPTESDIRARFAPYYHDIRFDYPGYDAGHCCPIVRFA